MTSDVFDQLSKHYAAVAEELRTKAQQAGLLRNSTAVGTDREDVYRTFLERHLPKTCDAFLGGFLFDLNGKSSAQIDVIVTANNTPRFQMTGGRHIAPLEGSIAVAEIKTRLDRDSLLVALENCASIPPMPDQQGIAPPYLKVNDEKWRDAPYKVVFAYDGANADTIYKHITDYYNERPDVPLDRRPNLVHVLGKYVIMRMALGMTVINPDGEADAKQPEVGEYHTFNTSPDVLAMGWILNELQKQAFLGNHLMFKYDEWHNKTMERVQRGSAH